VGKTITDVVRDLGRAGRVQAALALSDAQLIEQFALERDEAAFEAILRRHGPLVFGVCRRLLFNAHDAEDAFQATFLILARKAGGIDRPELLGNWLYGVAHRVAARARRSVCRRRAREQAGVDPAALPETERSGEPDVSPLIHEELRRLPDKYLRPVLLCYLEGKTNEEAAAQLRWPVGTVKTRLHKARELLRSRLARRGVALTAGLLSVDALTAAAPADLLQSTFQAGMSFASGAAACGASAAAITLTKGVLQVMFLSKLKLAAALALAALVIGGGVGGVVYHALAAEPVARPETASPDDKTKPADKPKQDKELIQGTWKVAKVESEGQDQSDKPGEAKFFMQSTWTITEGKMVLKTESHIAEMQFKLDPSAKPKTIDCTMTAVPNKEIEGKTFKGIYSLDGNTLKIHLPNDPGANRPTELETQRGGMSMMLVLKRPVKDG
jgi:RNA polymerase sigma-70 factor (ECF subfamily)